MAIDPSPLIVTDNDALRAQIGAWKARGERIVLVATMGNLHLGHMALVKAAKTMGGKVVVSIFVNPTQFGANEDLDAYPRTLEQDEALLREHAADLLYRPSVEAVYGQSHGNLATFVRVPVFDELLCGEFRPGHFQGVATVVNILFNLVQPHVAVFGEKDYQQLQVIKQMVRDLHMPVEICSVATVRDQDGLALSSRNRYLDSNQRQTAVLIYRLLKQTAAEISRFKSESNRQHHQQERGSREIRELEKKAEQALNTAGFATDYFAICNRDSLRAAEDVHEPMVILAAARLGGCRLIDNIQC